MYKYNKKNKIGFVYYTSGYKLKKVSRVDINYMFLTTMREEWIKALARFFNSYMYR